MKTKRRRRSRSRHRSPSPRSGRNGDGGISGWKDRSWRKRRSDSSTSEGEVYSPTPIIRNRQHGSSHKYEPVRREKEEEQTKLMMEQRKWEDPEYRRQPAIKREKRLHSPSLSLHQDSSDSGLSSNIVQSASPPDSESKNVARGSLDDTFDTCPLCRASLEDKQHFQRHRDEVFFAQLSETYFTNIMSAILNVVTRNDLEVFKLESKIRKLNLIVYPLVEHRRGFQCETCREFIYREKSVRLHKIRCPGSTVVLFCRFCDRVFDSKGGFEQHVSSFPNCFPHEDLLTRIYFDKTRIVKQKAAPAAAVAVVNPQSTNPVSALPQQDDVHICFDKGRAMVTSNPEPTFSAPFTNSSSSTSVFKYKNAYADFSDATKTTKEQEPFICYDFPTAKDARMSASTAKSALADFISSAGVGGKRASSPFACLPQPVPAAIQAVVDLTKLRANSNEDFASSFVSGNVTADLSRSLVSLADATVSPTGGSARNCSSPINIPLEMHVWPAPVEEVTDDGRNTRVYRCDVREDRRKKFPNYGESKFVFGRDDGQQQLRPSKTFSTRQWSLELGKRNGIVPPCAPRKLLLIPLDMIILKKFSGDNPCLCADDDDDSTGGRF